VISYQVKTKLQRLLRLTIEDLRDIAEDERLSSRSRQAVTYAIRRTRETLQVLTIQPSQTNNTGE
jgi:hypothetical protein